MQKITPMLWFDGRAEEAVAFYKDVFKEVNAEQRMEHDEESAKRSDQSEGAVMVIDFEIFGQKFIALNGGPQFKFNEAVSFVIDCESQDEVDYYWWRLTSDGGEESMCGWLKDKFGLSWQVTPRRLVELLSDPDKEKAGRAMQAMLSMKKIDVAKLEEAAGA
jgi:predicted 3-demethylubiquinone-9 3-methyltransferase (glyoxalase superfamily)